MAQATITATNCMLKTEMNLRQISGGLYDAIEKQGNTYATAAAIDDNTPKSMNQIIRADKARPGDPNCNEVQATVKYRKPTCGEGPDVCYDFTCASEAPLEDQYGYDTFTFENCVSQKFTVREDVFDCRPEELSAELATILASQVRQMYAKYNRKLSEKLIAAAGSEFGGATPTSATPLDLKLFFTNPANGALTPQPMGLTDLNYQYQRMAPDLGLAPVIVTGSRKMQAFSTAGQLFRGNTDGFDASNTTLGGVYLDWSLTNVAAAAGSTATDPTISFLPGSIDLVEYKRYDSPNRQIVDGRTVWAPTQATGTLIRQRVDVGTAILGRVFEVDMQIKYDECTNEVTYTLRKDFDLWTIPQDAFCAGDLHNYILMWNIACGAYDCTDLA